MKIKFLLILMITLLLEVPFLEKSYGRDSQINNTQEIDSQQKNKPSAKEYYFLKKLGDSYCNKEDFKDAIFYYTEAIKANKNEKDLSKLGLIYYINNEYNNSLQSFEEAYKLNPTNQNIRNEIEYIKYQISKKQKDYEINLMQPKENAPRRLHNLVEIKGKLNDKNDEQKLHKILDFIWSDKEGKILLQIVMKTRTPIYLLTKVEHSNVEAVNLGNINILGQAQLSSYNNLLAVNSINIKEKDIKLFQEKNSSISQNASCIMIVVHELCHMAKAMNYPNDRDSQEEEMSAYIIGSNIAHRILKGAPLSEEQVKAQATLIYNIIFNTPDCPYHNLKEKNDFANKFSKIGIEVPFYNVYSNFENLKFKETKNDIEIQNYINMINQQLSENYETIFSHKLINYSYDFYINKNGNVITLKDTTFKNKKYIEKEVLFNLSVIIHNKPFLTNNKDILLPIRFYRQNKMVKINYNL